MYTLACSLIRKYVDKSHRCEHNTAVKLIICSNYRENSAALLGLLY
jgi:hypothetical protein